MKTPALPKLKAAVKTRWLAALATARQASGRLTYQRNTDDPTVTEHCCWGVLCQLAAEDGIVTARPAGKDARPGVIEYGNRGGYSGELPPLAVLRWAFEELTPELERDHDVQLQAPGGQRPEWLAVLNDSGTDFATISDLIRDNL